MVINLQRKLNCSKHGNKPKNENKLFNTWL